jgi:hypothetical protein
LLKRLLILAAILLVLVGAGLAATAAQAAPLS